MKNRQSRGLAYGVGLLLSHLPFLLLAILLVGANPASAQLSGSAAGRQLMVNYIVHFAYHLEWPIEVFSGADAPFRICVMGVDSLVAPLTQRLRHQSINDRRAILERIDGKSLKQVRSCQILVLGHMNRASLLEILQALDYFPVLTVSEMENFAASGGMVEFASRGGAIALRLNKTMLDRAELKAGDGLFSLSQEVGR